MAKLFQKIFKKNRKCTVLKDNLTKKQIKTFQAKQTEQDVKNTNKIVKHYTCLEELIMEQGYVGEINE